MNREAIIIKMEVSESERRGALEKFREFFLKRGFIVEREWENRVELQRPVPVSRGNREIPYYPAIYKVQIQLVDNFVEFRCEFNKVHQFGVWLILASGIIDIVVLMVLFILLDNLYLFVVIVGLMLVSVIVLFFIFHYLPRQSINALSQDLQTVL